jgi:cation transport regulator
MLDKSSEKKSQKKPPQSRFRQPDIEAESFNTHEQSNNSKADLPGNLRKLLPKHAQEIYVKAYCSALKQYKNPEKRQGNEDLEVVAHKVAWSAVEQKYRKTDLGKWVERNK